MKIVKYICDKCKAEFDEKTYEKGECISLTFSKAPYEILKEGHAGKDLCSKCSMELLRWWKGAV